MNAYRAPLLERWHLRDNYGPTGLGIITLMAGSLLILFAIVFTSVLFGSRAYGRTSCRRWGEQTGYPSKFVVLNWADTGTCLAQAPNGRWVLNTKVLTFTGRKP